MTCQYCKKNSANVVELHGWKLCGKCREMLSRAKKKAKRTRDAASYLEALTHPDLRGLKGVRK